MDWNVLRAEDELEDIIRRSESKPQVIFKHSVRCSISTVAKGRLERSKVPLGADFHYLDLINYRNTSNKVAQVFNIHHESPQVLVIKNGQCVYDESHMGINMADIEDVVSQQS
jgi:bacillithiol system protein YtxJ